MTERPTTMTPEQLRAAMLLLGQDGKPIEQIPFAALTRRAPRTLRRYLSGRTRIDALFADRVHTLLEQRAGSGKPRKAGAK